MKILQIILYSIITLLFYNCDKKKIEWNLPRCNRFDSLQNVNASDPNWPVAKFTSSSTSLQIGGSISFLNTSLKNPSSINWYFENGYPSYSNISDPIIQYNGIGKYEVKLKVLNNFGTDSISKKNYIEAYYLKSFNNGLWDGWLNNGWIFSNSTNCVGCIYAWQNSTSIPALFTITKSFSNVSLNAKLEFYYYIYSPSGTIKVKVNNVELYSAIGYGAKNAVVQLPALSNFTITIEASVGYTQCIYLNDIKIRP
jgi:PKD repeat protein